MSNLFGMTGGQVAEMNAILFGDPFAGDAVEKAIAAREQAEDREWDERAEEAANEASYESGWVL